MEQIKVLSNQLATMDVINVHCQLSTPHIMNEVDIVSFSEARSQRRKVWFDAKSLQQATDIGHACLLPTKALKEFLFIYLIF